MTCRIIHGDCLEVLQDIKSESVDMVFMDPPYGHKNNDGDLISCWEAALGRGDYIPDRDNRPIANDGVEATGLLRTVLPQIRRVLKRGTCCCCCCGGGGPDPQFGRWSLLIDEFLDFKMAVVWDKGPMGMGWHYRRSYEFVFVAQKPGKSCPWFDQTRAIENVIRPGYAGIRKIIPSKQQHPTEKPWQLAAWFIELHTQPGELVLDPFCGSGSSGEACKRLGRNFIGVEIDAHWATVARQRIQRPVAVNLFKGM